jgi:serine/threonine protein kinase
LKGASNFKIRRKLDEGAVGEVFLVIHIKTQTLYAMKRMDRAKAEARDQVSEINNERIVLSRLKHKRIVNLKSAWADKKYFYMIFNYALNGDLH